MSLTKEMIMSVENDVETFDNESLLNYYCSYKYLNQQFPNSFYKFRIEKSLQEIVRRGINDEALETKSR